MNVNNNKSQSKDGESEFEGVTKDKENHCFYYVKGMQSKCISLSKHFLTYVGTKFGESER